MSLQSPIYQGPNGTYQVVRVLGRGGFGTVYEAIEQKSQQRCALKVIDFSSRADQQQVKTESAILQRYGSTFRFVPEIYDVWDDAAQLRTFIVMEYIEGSTLSEDLAERGAWPAADVEHFLRTLLDYLAQLHATGVIHRDIKPQNIKRTPLGRYVLLDFGIAKQGSVTLTAAKALSPDYAPPEQLKGEPTDARSDLYSLGATAYFLLTGMLPPSAGERLVHSAVLQPPSRLVPGVAAHLDFVFGTMLALEPAERPADAQTALKLLNPERDSTVKTASRAPRASLQARLPSGEEQSIDTVSASGVGAPPKKTRTVVISLLSVLLLVLIGVAVSFTLGRNSQIAATPTATASLAILPGASPIPIVTHIPSPFVASITDPTSVSPMPTITPQPETIALLHTLKGGSDWLLSVAFAPDGQIVASGSFDHTIALWRVQDGVLLHTLKQHTDWVMGVAFAPDGQTLASASKDQTINLWRTSDGTLLHTLAGHTDTVASVAFSPDGYSLASASKDQTIRLWRVSDGALLHTLAGHTGFVRSVAFSPDGQTLASAADDNTVKLWRAGDGTLLRTLNGHGDAVYAVAFAPDGQTVVSGSVDQTVKLWRTSDGSLLRTLAGHRSTVNSVAFAPDGQTVASGSYDRTVKIWRAGDGAVLQTLAGHEGAVFGVAFASDGHTLASVSEDQTIKLWQVQP